MKPRLILGCLTTENVVARARADFDAVIADGADDMTGAELVAAATTHKAQAVVFTTTTKLDAQTIAALPDSVHVAATVSVGYDHVDVAAAKVRGLIVTNTPDVLTDCTADHAMLMILGACRRACDYEQIMRVGWRRRIGQGELLGLRVSGKRLGILGMGRIGQAVAARARGFRMEVLYHARHRLPPEREAGARYFADFHAMLPECDILTLHAPAGPATDRIINAKTLSLLPQGAVFVNASRGGLVDEDALLEALQSGRLFAAGLDVFRSEPDFDARFIKLSNVFMTPHMASATRETRDGMGFRALDNAAAVLAGRPPGDPVWH